MEAGTKPTGLVNSGLIARNKIEASLNLHGIWSVECVGADGKIKWTENVHNLITTAGVNKLLDACFKTGYTTPTWYIGLIATNTTFLIADTMASHGTWTDSVPYSNAARPTWTPGTISGGSVDNTGSPASFTINASATVLGAFLVDNSTKSGTTGDLYAEVAFGTSRTVASGDTLNVTYTLTATAG